MKITRPPWTSLHAQLHQTLRSRQLLPRKGHILIAVSGGQDSVCLAQLLVDLQPKWGWHLAIAHCDHRWRVDSQANAEFVQQLAQTWQLPYYQETAIEITKSEAQARQWRYQALSAIAQTHHYAYIVTGHTQSDRAETLLYNLIRGTGADGLQALTWQRPLTPNIQLIRPLLEMSRTQTGEFCRQFNLKIWEDSTNQDLHYARNRIRQELLPYLQTHFNPQTEQAIAQTAELLRADVEYLEATASQLLQESLSQKPIKVNDNLAKISLNRCLLQVAPLALQRRVMRQLLQQILPSAPTFEQVEKLTHLIHAHNRTCTDPFPGGAIAQVQGDWIIFREPE